MNNLASIIDTIKGSSGPATARDYATTGLIDFFIGLVIMIIFLSLIMEGVRYLTTTAKKGYVPQSMTNEFVWVLTTKIPDWAFYAIQTAMIAGIIIIIRGAFGLVTWLTIPFDRGEYLALAEISAAFGFLALAYRIAGPMIARRITHSLIKSKVMKSEKIGGGEVELDSGEKIPAVISQEEYLAMGKEVPQS